MAQPATITLANGQSIDTPKWHKERYRMLLALRQPFNLEWDTLQRYILPKLNRDFVGKRKRHKPMDTDNIINTTGTQAHTVASGGMQVAITPPARRWMKMAHRPQAPGADVPGVWREWLQYADDNLFSFWDRTDLYGMLAGIYDEHVLLGTAAGMGTPVYGDPDVDFVWKQILGGEYCIVENSNGLVDTIYRKTMMTVAQLVERYGRSDGLGGQPDWKTALSGRVRQAWEGGKWQEPVELLQVIGPSPFLDAYVGDANALRYQEVVMEMEGNQGVDDKPGNFLSRNRFRVMPAFCGRWEWTGSSPWGMSPGMEALPDVRQLQEMEEKKGTALSLLINPPLQGPPSLANQRVTSLPGDVNYVEGIGAGQPLMPVYQVRPDIDKFAMEMERVEARVRRTFYADLFMAFIERPGIQPLNESEIWERKEEKLMGLGPVLDRLDREIIRPIVEISLDYLITSGEMDAPPEGLEDADIEYLNIIAVAQKTQGLTAISDTVSFISTVAEKQAAVGMEPTAWDHLDVSETVKGFATRRGADMRILRDDDEVEELQEQRAQARAQQAQLEAAQQAAATAKDAAAADELAARTAADQGPLATGGGPGGLPPEVGALAP